MIDRFCSTARFSKTFPAGSWESRAATSMGLRHACLACVLRTGVALFPRASPAASSALRVARPTRPCPACLGCAPGDCARGPTVTVGAWAWPAAAGRLACSASTARWAAVCSGSAAGATARPAAMLVRCVEWASPATPRASARRGPRTAVAWGNAAAIRRRSARGASRATRDSAARRNAQRGPRAQRNPLMWLCGEGAR